MPTEQQLTARISEPVFRRDSQGRKTSEQIGYVVEETQPVQPLTGWRRWVDMGVSTRYPEIRLTSVHGQMPNEGDSLIPGPDDETRTVVHKSKFFKSDNPLGFLPRARAEKEVQVFQAGLDKVRRRHEHRVSATKAVRRRLGGTAA